MTEKFSSRPEIDTTNIEDWFISFCAVSSQILEVPGDDEIYEKVLIRLGPESTPMMSVENGRIYISRRVLQVTEKQAIESTYVSLLDAFENSGLSAAIVEARIEKMTAIEASYNTGVPAKFKDISLAVIDIERELLSMRDSNWGAQ